MKPFAWIGALLALAGCSGADILNLTVPRDGYALHRSLPYGEGERRTLDIYTPDGASNAPVVVFFYGGRWQDGSKEDYLFTGQALASRGFVTVIADYSLYPDARYPAFLEDGAEAVRWVQSHITTHGGDARNVTLAGHSAGAYIAVMLGLDSHYNIQARNVIGIAGPYDFFPFEDADIKDIFLTGAATQPINHVRTNAPRMLLATGDADTSVYPRNTRALAEKLRASGNEVEEIYYPGIGHIGIILSLSRPFRYKAPLLDDMAKFIQKN